MEDVERHQSQLDSTVSAGHALEGYTSADDSDIGYTALEDRYGALKVREERSARKNCEKIYILHTISWFIHQKNANNLSPQKFLSIYVQYTVYLTPPLCRKLLLVVCLLSIVLWVK